MSYTTGMRYNTNLIAPNQIKLMDDIKLNRPLVFSRDLMFFVTQKYQRNWRPFLNPNYTIHDRSPLTHSVRRAVYLILRNMDDVYTFNYYELIEPSGENQLAEFASVARSLFNIFRNLEKKSINVLFDAVVYVARMAVECEFRGVRDAPHMAVMLINLFLRTLEKDVFALIHQHALDIIDICEGDAE